MTPISWTDVGTAAGATLAVLGVLGAAYRWILLPNLRDELRPMRQVSHELSGNADEPSLRELVSELTRKHDQHSGEIEDATLELRAMALMFDGHLEWAQAEVDLLRRERQAAVDEIWRELNRQRNAGIRPPAPGRHKREGEE